MGHEEDINHILSLEEDFDERGSPAYKKETIEKALKYIPLMKKRIEERKLGTYVEPDILPGPNGSIDVHWETEEYEILMNVPVEDRPATYYGDDYPKNKAEDGTHGKNRMEGELRLE